MTRRKLNFLLGIIFLLIAIAIFFVLPEAAFNPSGRKDVGNIYLGLKSIFGEYGARYFMALPFAFISWIEFKKAWKPKNTSN